MNPGKERFKKDLVDLGYPVTDRDGGWLIVDEFRIEEGRFAGQVVAIAFNVPGDYSLNAPHGPHMKPMLFPINTDSNDHKVRMHASELGSDWGQLSRPYPKWDKSKRTTKKYMQYVKHLFDTL